MLRTLRPISVVCFGLALAFGHCGSQAVYAQSVLPDGVSAGFSYENGGTEAVGPYKLRSFVQFDDLFKTGEMIRIDGTATPEFEELRGIGLRYEQPFLQNWRLRINASTSETIPGGDLSRVYRQTTQEHGWGGTVLGSTISYVFQPSDVIAAELTAGFQSRDSKTRRVPDQNSILLDALDGFRLLGETFNQRTRDLQISAAINYDITKSTVLYSAIGADFGVDWVDPAHERKDVDDTPTVLHYAVSFKQNLPNAFQIALRGNAQWSNERLNQLKMFGLGGWDYATAYDPGEEVGDIGGGGRAEINAVGVFHLGSGLDLYFQPAVFVDGGFTRINDPIPGEAEGNKYKSSVGAALSIELTNGIHGGLQVSRPIGDAPNLDNGKKEPRWLFSVGIKQ